MIPWECIDRTDVPDMGGELVFYKRAGEYSIRANGFELMNSRTHASEDALATLAIERVLEDNPKILIGGLGMGYTLSAALRCMEKTGYIHVAELVPAVVLWNQKHLGHLSGYPLSDPRTRIFKTDIAHIIRRKCGVYDAILLDVDNGPEGLTRKDNDWLYTTQGLIAAGQAIKPGGILAIWSSSPNEVFTKRLKNSGFKVKTKHVRARNSRKGGHHTIWLASKI